MVPTHLRKALNALVPHLTEGTIAIRFRLSLGVALILVAALFLAPGGEPARALDACDPATCGELGPLIPFHKDAIHAAVIWVADEVVDRVKICF